MGRDVDPKQVFVESFIEAPTLDEWVAATFSDSELTSLGEMEDMSGWALSRRGYPLDYHWQREELYMAYKEDVWLAVESWAEMWADDATVLTRMVDAGDGVVIDTHEAFVDVMVTRALAVVANDLMTPAP